MGLLMKETDLYDLVKPFLLWRSPNARVYTELEDRDIVIFEDLVENNLTYISEFELKLSLNKELLKQLCNRDNYSKGHYLYAVVPIKKANQEIGLSHLFRKMGWGLITVNTHLVRQFPDYPMRYCKIEVEPEVKNPMKVHIEPMQSKLFKELQGQAGGSVRTKKFTGFKADLENIYFTLKGLSRPRSYKAILALMSKQGVKMANHTIQHRLKCLNIWGIVTVSKRGRTSLYIDNKLGDEATTDKILSGSKKRVR